MYGLKNIQAEEMVEFSSGVKVFIQLVACYKLYQACLFVGNGFKFGA